MPFSSECGKAYTKKLLQKIIKYFPKMEGYNVLDVGVGSGTYSNLYRSLIPGMWTGVEIWEPYIEKYNLKDKYDILIRNDIRQMSFEKYDIAFLGDVVEHMTKDEAISTIFNLLEHVTFIFISIPIIPYPQGEYDSNPYEAHVKDDWSHEEVLDTFMQYIVVSDVEKEIGVYVLTKNPQAAYEILRPKVAVYGIFKNEEKFIERFLESCKDADEIVLCDTGSTDKTISKIEEFVNNYRLWNKVFVEKITVLPWRFDDARNTALQYVSPEIDICISLDSDEYLCKNWKEILLSKYDSTITRYYHRFCSFWNEEETNKAEHWHERIHVRDGYRWSLPVHEILERYTGDENVKWLHDFWMYQKPDMTKDRGSYMSMLEVSTTERPDIWKSWSFLASEYYTHGRGNDAINALDKALTIENSDKSFLYNFKATILNSLGKFDEAISSLRSSINYSPYIREYQVYLAELYYNQYINTEDKSLKKMLLENAKMIIAGASLITTRSDGYVYNQNCWDNGFEEIKKKIMETQ